MVRRGNFYGQGAFRFRGRSSNVNRSNLRVIVEAQDDSSSADKSNNVAVPAPALSEKVQEDLMKKYKDDLDEVSDSPLIDDADDLENVSDDSLCGDDLLDHDDLGVIVMKGEVPVGYRKYTNKHLPKYKRMAFFRPRLYCVSQERIIVGCVNTITSDEMIEASPEIKPVENSDLISSKEILEPTHGTLQIQENLDKSSDSLIGLQFLVEIWEEIEVSFKCYLCLLCNEELEKEAVLDHFISISHKIAYLDKHFPKFTSMFFKNAVNEISDAMNLYVENVCKDVIGSESLPFIATADYMDLYQHKLKKRVTSSWSEKDPIVMCLTELSLITAMNLENPMDPMDLLSLYNSVTFDDDIDNQDADFFSSNDDEILILEEVNFKDEETNNKNEIVEDVKNDLNDGEIVKANDVIENQEKDSLSTKHAFRKSCGKCRNVKCKKHYHTRMHYVERISKPKESSEAPNHEMLKTDNSKDEDVTKDSSIGSTKKTVSKKSSHTKKHEDEKISPKHCEKCNGVKRSYRIRNENKHSQNCDCKKSSSLDKKSKQKDGINKNNSSHEVDPTVITNKQRKSPSITKRHSDISKKTSKHDMSVKNIENKQDEIDKAKANTSAKQTSRNSNTHSQSSKQTVRSSTRSSPHKGRHRLSPDRSSVKRKNHSQSPSKSVSVNKRSRSPHQKSNEIRNKSPVNKVRRSRSPFITQKRSKSPLSLRRRSRSPLRIAQRRSKSPAINRYRSRSPLGRVPQRSRSPHINRKPQFINRRHSRSPVRAIHRVARTSITRRQSRSPIRVNRRVSRSPLNRRHSRSPALINRRVSKTPLVNRRFSRSPLVNRRRSRSPFVNRRLSRSPGTRQRRSTSPSNTFHKKTISPFLSNSQLPSKRGFDRNTRSPNLLKRGAQSRKSPNRLQRRRSRSPRKHSNSNSRGTPSDNRFAPSIDQFGKPFLGEEVPSFNVAQPVFPSNVPTAAAAAWPNPNEAYNYPYQQPATNVPYVPPNFPPYATQVPPQVPQVPYYPNTAFPPSSTNTLPPQNLQTQPPNFNFGPPPGPLVPQAPFNPLANPQLRYSMPGSFIQANNPQAQHHGEKAFHDLRNVVTKLFGVPDANKPVKKSEPNIPFAKSLNSSESKNKLYMETMQKLREEFGNFPIPDEMFKNALKDIFPEDLLKNRAIQLLKEKKDEQKPLNETKIPNMNAKVAFKESVHAPSQGNIFPIVKHDVISSNSSANFSRKETALFGNKLHSEFPRSDDRPKQDSSQKTLAQRLASVLVKLGMVDVPGPLLAEMLHKIGAFNRSLPLQDITENQIISLLNRCGYLRS